MASSTEVIGRRSPHLYRWFGSCNGTTVEGRYVYIVTDTYPFVSRCMNGEVSGYQFGGGGGRGGGSGQREGGARGANANPNKRRAPATIRARARVDRHPRP